jgi:hypothetical protein
MASVQGRERGRHCDECSECVAVARRFDQLLSIRPWEESPLQAVTEDPPDYCTAEQAADWRAAWATRCELVKEEKKKIFFQ